MDGEKEKTDKVDPNIPPKLDLKQAVSPQPAKKATTRIDMASAAMIPEEKSKTTRINLGSFGDAVPKTIKIQRPSEAATIKLNRTPPSPSLTSSGPVTPLSPAPAAPPPSQAQSKRQTSRISLQEAFTAPTEAPATGAPAEAPQAPGPKTIRIKRPSDVGGGAVQETIHAPAAAAPATQAAPAQATQAAPAADVGGPATQRKTIKLRRPGAGEGEGARSSVTLPKAAADFAAAQAAGDVGEDEPGPAFAILSLLAVLVCAVLVYVLAVQAFPNLGLSWTGQVPTLR